MSRVTLNIILVGIIAVAIIFFAMRYSGKRQENYMVPKLLVTHEDTDQPPFIDATGAHAGALLGDVKHDPFQSGGLETPAHERLEVGAIHKASQGRAVHRRDQHAADRVASSRC